MLQRYRVAVPWLVALVLLAAGAASGAPQYYVVTDLGTLGSGGSFATAVNSSGVVVGYTYPLGPTPYPAAFAYSGGTIQDLGQGASARAYGIDGPLAVGRNSDEQAFLDDLATGVTTLLTPATTDGGLGPVASTAYGVNAGGQVVGQSTIFTGSGNAGLWTVGSGGAVTATDLGTLGSCAYGINDSGLIAGYSATSAGAYHAVLFNTGGGTVAIADIGTLGGTTSEAYAINNSGQVVGLADTSDGVGHAFLWTASAGMSNLDAGSSLGETASTASAVNSAGSVVGSMTLSSGAVDAFLYSGGTMLDLNSLVSPTADWTLGYAKGINDSGQIAGSGTNPAGQTDAFLLTPATPGDANLDGKVDINDLTIVLAHYGQTGTTWTDGEFTGDGKVDINDLTIVLAHYNETLGSSAGPGIGAVPEPAGLLLLATGLAGLLASARRKRTKKATAFPFFSKETD